MAKAKGKDFSSSMAPRHAGARTAVPDAKAEALIARIEERERSPIVQTSERPDVQTLERSDVQASTTDPRLVARKGRIRADGSRTGARVLRRSTVYLSPDLAQRLDVAAVTTGQDRSEIVAAALEAYLAGKPGA